ncbi:HPr family phosphocarrier protein [Verrucomicrobiales bacterium]|jgi:phosphocarrier protein HPr|nr:HPr family phosphocarrier protein [Verrucomicrobiales bacterium]MDA9922056.1 HPr family phosphocarrier protein [Verrucomicrobiales bacterium]MDB2495771.1 HPr family phosphocarrier protein [Verrucomicrobiales bacterium]MDB2642651.1 HPr family phosphocarrier protein [bacterium]
MPTCQLTIPNEEGLHARPAAKFVKLANQFPCEIWVEKDDEEINGKSIMGLMMLAAAEGSVISVSAEGEKAETALEKLAELVDSGFEIDV